MGRSGGKFGKMSGGNGGIEGSGVFGMIGTTIQCKAEDTSIYCNIMKFFNLLVIFIIALAILYVIYTFVSFYTRKGR